MFQQYILVMDESVYFSSSRHFKPQFGHKKIYNEDIGGNIQRYAKISKQ